MKKNQVKLGMIVRVDYGPCGRVVEIDNEKDFYPYKVRYSGGLAEWASAYQMDEVLDAPEEVLDAPEEVLDAPVVTCTLATLNPVNPRNPRTPRQARMHGGAPSANSVIPCWCNPPCSTCKYGDLPGTVGPCASCFDEGLDHPLNYEEATESGDEGTVGSGIKGIVPQHIVDMFTERVKQAALRFVNECNAHPRPCPYCGEIPEVVEEAIYPGEKHCYVVCNGAKLLPHSISIHGRTREEAAAHWNSFVLTMKSQEK